jgi:hypothetical protein
MQALLNVKCLNNPEKITGSHYNNDFKEFKIMNSFNKNIDGVKESY